MSGYLAYDELSVALSYAVSMESSGTSAHLPPPPPKSAKKPVEAPAPPAKKAADDFDDMFGDEAAPAPAAPAPPAAPAVDDIFGDVADADETEEEKAATIARRERMEAARKLKEAKDLAEGKKKKEKEAEKSLIVLEVKPWEANCDLVALFHKIVEYKQEGLTWGEAYKLEPVAYGIMKLVMQCTIIDKLVLMDDITENIEAMDEFVQEIKPEKSDDSFIL